MPLYWITGFSVIYLYLCMFTAIVDGLFLMLLSQWLIGCMKYRITSKYTEFMLLEIPAPCNSGFHCHLNHDNCPWLFVEIITWFHIVEVMRIKVKGIFNSVRYIPTGEHYTLLAIDLPCSLLISQLLSSKKKQGFQTK